MRASNRCWGWVGLRDGCGGFHLEDALAVVEHHLHGGFGLCSTFACREPDAGRFLDIGHVDHLARVEGFVVRVVGVQNAVDPEPVIVAVHRRQGRSVSGAVVARMDDRRHVDVGGFGSAGDECRHGR